MANKNDSKVQAAAILNTLRTDRYAAMRKGNLYSRVAVKLNRKDSGVDSPAGEAYWTGPGVAALLGEKFETQGR